MPQEELDRLRDYYCLYGQYDKDGKPTGLLKRQNNRLVPNDTKDVDFATFRRMQAALAAQAEEAPDAERAKVTAAAIDALAPLG